MRVTVPDALVAELDKLVDGYAELHSETPEGVRRAIEIALLQRGVRSLQEDLALRKGAR